MGDCELDWRPSLPQWGYPKAGPEAILLGLPATRRGCVRSLPSARLESAQATIFSSPAEVPRGDWRSTAKPLLLDRSTRNHQVPGRVECRPAPRNMGCTRGLPLGSIWGCLSRCTPCLTADRQNPLFPR